MTDKSGAVIGGTFGAGSITFYALAQLWPGFNTYSLVIGGAALVFTAVKNPEGIAGTPVGKIRRRRRAEATAADPDPGPPPGLASPGSAAGTMTAVESPSRSEVAP